MKGLGGFPGQGSASNTRKCKRSAEAGRAGRAAVPCPEGWDAAAAAHTWRVSGAGTGQAGPGTGCAIAAALPAHIPPAKGQGRNGTKH